MTELTVNEKLHGSLAGYIARALDKKDGKKDGYINANIWNDFVENKIKIGKVINNKINVENAMNSIATYARRTAKSTGKTENQVAKQWKAEFLGDLDVQIQNTTVTKPVDKPLIKQKNNSNKQSDKEQVKLPDGETVVPKELENTYNEILTYIQNNGYTNKVKFSIDDDAIIVTRKEDNTVLVNTETDKEYGIMYTLQESLPQKITKKEPVKLPDGETVVPEELENTYNEILKFIQEKDCADKVKFSINDDAIIVKSLDNNTVLLNTKNDAAIGILETLESTLSEITNAKKQSVKEPVKLPDGETVVPEELENTYNEILKFIQEKDCADKVKFSIDDDAIIVTSLDNNTVLLNTKNDAYIGILETLESTLSLMNIELSLKNSEFGEGGLTVQQSLPDGTPLSKELSLTYQTLRTIMQGNGFDDYFAFKKQDDSLVVCARTTGEIVLETQHADADAIKKLQDYIDSKKTE